MPAMHRIPPPLNFGLYQLAWFACVMGAGSGHFLAGVIAVLAVCGLHLAASPHPGREFGIILATGFIGAAWETLLVKGGWVRYHGNGLEQFPPVWIVALWLAFATTFNASLRWLQGRHLLAAVLGLLGGPLAWYAGEHLQALELPDRSLSLAIIGLGWALLMPLLLHMAERLGNGANPPEKAHV